MPKEKDKKEKKAKTQGDEAEPQQLPAAAWPGYEFQHMMGAPMGGMPPSQMAAMMQMRSRTMARGGMMMRPPHPMMTGPSGGPMRGPGGMPVHPWAQGMAAFGFDGMGGGPVVGRGARRSKPMRPAFSGRPPPATAPQHGFPETAVGMAPPGMAAGVAERQAADGHESDGSSSSSSNSSSSSSSSFRVQPAAAAPLVEEAAAVAPPMTTASSAAFDLASAAAQISEAPGNGSTVSDAMAMPSAAEVDAFVPPPTSAPAWAPRTPPEREQGDEPLATAAKPALELPPVIGGQQLAASAAAAAEANADDEDDLPRPKPLPKPGKISFSIQGAKAAVAAAQAQAQAEEAVAAARARRLNTRDASTQTVRDPEHQDGDIVTIWRLRPRGMESFPHFPRQGKRKARELATLCAAVDEAASEVPAMDVAAKRRKRIRADEKAHTVAEDDAVVVGDDDDASVAEADVDGEDEADAEEDDAPKNERLALIEALRSRMSEDGPIDADEDGQQQ